MSRFLSPYFIVFLLFVLFAGISNYIWIKEDNSICGVDSQNHLLFSIEFFYVFSDIIHESTFPIWLKIKHIFHLIGRPVVYSSVYWPNGLNLTASAFYSLLGKSLFSAKLSLLPYLFILLLSTYLIGKLMFSDFVGLVASFLLFMYPIIFQSSRQFQLDFPLTAMVALNILLLLKCDNFKYRKYSFLFGLSLGWAMLIKGQAILFVIWPLFWVLYKTFKDLGREMWGNRLRSRQLQSLIIFTIVASLLASVWWLHQIEDAKYSLIEHIFNKQKALESFFSWDEKYSFASITFHFKALFSSLSPFLFLTFLISLPLFLKRKIKYKGIYLSWLIIPFLLFSLVFTIKHPRFLMPIIPAMGLITARGLYQIKNKKLRMPLLFFIIIFGFIQFYILSFRDYKYRDISIGFLKIFGRSDYETGPPHKEDLEIDKVVRIMRKYTFINQPVKIGSISCGHSDRPATFETVYWLKMKDRFLYPIDLTEMHRSFLENFGCLDFILFRLPLESSLDWPGGEEFRILLRKNHYCKIHQLETEDFIGWNRLLKILEDAKSNFQLIGKVLRDNRDVYYIYKKKK